MDNARAHNPARSSAAGPEVRFCLGPVCCRRCTTQSFDVWPYLATSRRSIRRNPASAPSNSFCRAAEETLRQSRYLTHWSVFQAPEVTYLPAEGSDPDGDEPHSSGGSFSSLSSMRSFTAKVSTTITDSSRKTTAIRTQVGTQPSILPAKVGTQSTLPSLFMSYCYLAPTAVPVELLFPLDPKPVARAVLRRPICFGKNPRVNTQRLCAQPSTLHFFRGRK